MIVVKMLKACLLMEIKRRYMLPMLLLPRLFMATVVMKLVSETFASAQIEYLGRLLLRLKIRRYRNWKQPLINTKRKKLMRKYMNIMNLLCQTLHLISILLQLYTKRNIPLMQLRSIKYTLRTWRSSQMYPQQMTTTTQISTNNCQQVVLMDWPMLMKDMAPF